MPTQLHLHERAGDAAARPGKVSGSNNLRSVEKTPADQKWGISDAAIGACRYAYPDMNDVLDFVLLLQRLKAVRAHDFWLQHITRASVQTEEGAVQLGVFIWEEWTE